jgi:hypothetical protein
MILHWDGFDRILFADLPYTFSDPAITISAAGRDSTSGLTSSNDTAYFYKAYSPTDATKGYVGLALYVPSLPGSPRKLIQIVDSNALTVIFTFVLKTDGTLEAFLGTEAGSSLGVTISPVVIAADWSYIEVGWFIDPALGFIYIRNENVTVMSATDQNTASLGGAWDIVRVYPGTSCVVDDFYVMDGSGAPSYFIGAQQVLTVPPVTNGARLDWTSSSGVGQVEDCDDVTHDGDATYIWADSNGDKYTATFTVVSTAFVVNGVALNAVAREDVGVDVRLKHMVRISGVDDPAPTALESVLLTASYVRHAYVWRTNPNLGIAWSIDSINAAEFGVQRIN